MQALPMSLGVDLVDVPRIERMLDRHGRKFLERVYTEGEIQYCLSHRRPGPHLAARFSVKESVSKALGTGIAAGIQWTDIEVERSPEGKPSIVLHGVAKTMAESLGIGAWLVSYSHTETLAMSQVIGIQQTDRPMDASVLPADSSTPNA